MGIIGVQTSISARPMRVSLQSPGVSVPDGDGGWTQGWGDLNPPAVFAKVQPATARDIERLSAGTTLATATHLVFMPFHKDVSTLSRLSWVDDAGRTHTANVTGVVNVDERCRELIVGVVEVVD